MRGIRTAVAVALLACGVGGWTEGASIRYGVGLSSHTQPGFFPQFDPRLGMLTEVDFSASGRLGATYLIDSFPLDSYPPAPVSGAYKQVIAFIAIDTNGGPGLGFDSLQAEKSYTSSGAWIYIDDTFSYSKTITNASALNRFTGTSRFNLQIVPYAEILTPKGLDATYLGASADGGATVTYVYTPAGLLPAPSSLVMLSLGLAPLAGLAWYRRRGPRELSPGR